MANVVDAIKLLITGDGSQFREDVEKDKTTLEGLLANLHDRDMNIGVNAVKAQEKLQAIQNEVAELQNINMKLDADDAESQYKIEDTKLKLEEIMYTVLNLDVHDEKAQAEILQIKTELMSIHESYVNLHVNDGAAVLQLDMFRAKLEELSNMTPGEGSGSTPKLDFGAIDPLLGTILTLLPTIAPLAAVAAGAVGGLGAAFSAAGAGALGFGLVAKSNLDDVFKAATDVAKAQHAYDEAVNDKQRQKALQEEQSAWGEVDKQQKSAVVSLMSFKDTWRAFTAQFEAPVLQAFTNALGLLDSLMTAMSPTIRSAGDAIAALIGDAGNAVKNDPEVIRFFTFLADDAGPAITSLGQAFGNVMRGIMSLLAGFSPLAVDMQNGLVGMTQRFADWSAAFSKSEAFQKFVSYVETNGPQVLTLLGNLAKIIVDLLTDLAPLGAVMLPLINNLLSLVDTVLKGNPALVEFGGAFLSSYSILKLLGPVLTAVASGYGLVKDAIVATTVANEALEAAEIAVDAVNPIGWIVLAVAALGALAYEIYKHWDEITSATVKAWHAIENFFVNTWNNIVAFFKKEGPTIAHWLPFGDLVVYIVTHWDQIKTTTINTWNAITKWLADAWKSIKEGAVSLWRGLADTWNAIVSGAESIWTRFTSWLQGLWDGFTSWIVNTAVKFAQDVVASFKWLYDHNYYFQALVDFIVNAWNWVHDTSVTVWDAITGALDKAWTWITNTAKLVVNNIVTQWNEISDTTSAIWGAISDFFVNLWEGIKSVAVDAAIWVVTNVTNQWNAISDAWHSVWDPIAQFFTDLWNGISDTTSTVWTDIENFVVTHWNTIYDSITSVGTDIGNFFVGLWDEAKSWGSNLINMIFQGIEDEGHIIASAAEGVAGKIARFLGFHSPTEDGPASDSDKWAPNFVRMFAEGLKAGETQVGEASSTLVTPLTQRVKGALDYLESVTKSASENGKKRIEQEKSTLESIYSTAQTYNQKKVEEEQKYQDAITKVKTDAMKKEQDATDSYVKAQIQVEDDLKKARQDAADQYEKDVQQVEQNLQQSIQQAWASYNNAVNQRSSQLLNPSGLFDTIQKQAVVSADGLMRSLQSQVDQLESWSANVASLSKRGVDQSMIEAIQQMGPQSAAQVKALTSMTDEQLQQYVALWKRKQKDANTEATTELTGLKKQTEDQIAQLQAAASAKLDQLKATYSAKLAQLNADAVKKLGDLSTAWKTTMTQIETDTTTQLAKLTTDFQKNMETLQKEASKQFQKFGEDGSKEGSNAIASIASAMGQQMLAMASQAQQWGRNLVNSMVEGMQSASGGLASAAAAASDSIHDYLGFHSPSKKGAGATANQWMPNLMNMLIDGVQQYTPALQRAVSTVLVSPSLKQMVTGSAGIVTPMSNTPNVTLTVPLTISGNVYGVDDLQKTVIGVMEQHGVPVLLKALKPASRSMG